jgi:hypothetical protein
MAKKHMEDEEEDLDLDEEEEFEEEEEREEKKKTPKPRKEKQQKTKLPVFLELVFDISGFLMLMVPVAVGMMSYLAGVDWLNIVLRTAIAIFVTGILCCAITRQIVAQSVDITNQMLEEASQSAPAVES